VVAAGGICDGRSMAAAFALGAEGVQLGTRIVSAAESPVHDNYKQLVVDSAETGTVFLNRWHKPSFRVLATERSEAHERSDERVTLGTLDGILKLYFEGDLDAAFAFGGQVAGRIQGVEPVGAIIRDMIDEFHAVVADLSPTGTAHVAFVRSTMAHARLTSVDTTDAEAMPGVVGVFTKDTLSLAPVQGFVMLPPVFSRPPLADGLVRFVGDIVAVVVAETRAQAVDASELVVIDYEPLPTLVDVEAALEPDAPQLFPDHGSNVAIEFNFGEDPTVLEGADVVVQGRFVNQRVAPAP